MLTIKLGPFMTKEEAKERYCPFVMNAEHSNSYTCLADECMAWMWVYDIPTDACEGNSLSELLDRMEEEGAATSWGFCCK